MSSYEVAELTTRIVIAAINNAKSFTYSEVAKYYDVIHKQVVASDEDFAKNHTSSFVQ